MPGYDLKVALQKLQQKRQNFALFRGEEGDQIFISSRPPTPKQLVEIEKETGDGKRVLKGVCFREGTGIVFATRNPAAPAWEKMLSTVMKERKCAQFLPISLRQLSPQESEEASEDDPAPAASASGSAAPASSPGGDVQAEWERFKSSLMPQLRAALADPATKEKVTKIVLAARASEQAGAYAAAIAIFQRLAGVLHLPVAPPVAPSIDSPVAPTVTPPVAPTAPVRAPKAGKLQAAMNKLTPAFKRAVVASPARKAEILQPVILFQRQLKEGQLEEARETLRQASRVLQTVLAPTT